MIIAKYFDTFISKHLNLKINIFKTTFAKLVKSIIFPAKNKLFQKDARRSTLVVFKGLYVYDGDLFCRQFFLCTYRLMKCS